MTATTTRAPAEPPITGTPKAASARCPTPSEEAWLARRLNAPHLFLGLTTPDIRRERVRARILELGVEHTPAGRRFTTNALETYGELFRRLYQEDL